MAENMGRRRKYLKFTNSVKVRQVIDFTEQMHKQIQEHGNKRGCRSFSEAVRDIIRLWFDCGEQKKTDKAKDD
jgi:Arc/MetJ-type ribon-helix-helix transcriptional regulator